MSWSFAWASCAFPTSPTTAMKHIQEHGVRFLHLQGDTPYLWYSGNTHGVNAPAITKTSTAADIALHHAQQRAAPYWAEYISWAEENDRPIYYMPDDHEWGGDNWDHTIVQANTGMPLSCTTQAEVNAHWLAGITAARQYMSDNPINADAEAVLGDIPSQALVGDTPAASAYPINYFRVGYDLAGNVVSSNPLIEFFVIDCISYRSPLSATDDASKTMLGATQKAWLKARVVASTATFKIIFSNKKLTFNTPADNTDVWSYYTSERNEILAYFDGAGVTSAPWLVGDRHVPNVAYLRKTSGFAADVLCVCACPMGVENNSGAQANLADPLIWLAKYGQKYLNVYGLGVVDADRITLQLRNSIDAGIVWQGYMEAGTNHVQYPQQRFS